MYTIWFYLFQVQEQANLTYDIKSQDSGYPCGSRGYH